jgi:predicted permease
MLALFFFPLADILSGEEQLYTFRFDGLYYAGHESVYIQTIPPIILLSVIVAVTFISIFLYRRRITQMRLNFFNMLLMLGYAGLVYFYVRDFSKTLDSELVNYKIFDAFPFVAAIFSYMAIRAIGKDEALIRSIDRIR